MIFVCEPTVTGASHEKVNCGFLKGLQIAYPGQQVTLFADPSHIEAMKRLAPLDGLDLERMVFVPVPFGGAPGFLQFFRIRTLLRSVFRRVTAANGQRVFFLSGSGPVMKQAKILLHTPEFETLELSVVLHGELEDIATDRVPSLPLVPLPVGRQALMQKVKDRGVSGLLETVLRRARNAANIPSHLWRWYHSKYLGSHQVLEWRHSDRIRYVALSPRVVENAARYVDVEHLNIGAVVLPTVFRSSASHISSDHVRFAVFGYGNAQMLYNVMLRLRDIPVKRPYEVRIIGMDNRGMSEFPQVKAVSPGRFMDRREMESHVDDIDMFLILYERTRYRLSCSNAILEALSYMKPIIHLENDCIDFFNPAGAPIGYRATSVEEYAARMADVIENFPQRRADLEMFATNLRKQRQRYSVESQAPAIRAAIEGPPA